MVNWSCASALCFNNHRTRDKNGQPIYKYRLPRNEEIQRQYQSILRNENINWLHGHICCEHWSSGYRESVEHIPDVTVPQSQLEKLSRKLQIAAKAAEKKGDLSSIRKKKQLKRKLTSAENYFNSTPSSSRKPPTVRTSSPSYIKRKRLKSRRQLVSENAELKKNNLILTDKINKLQCENLALKAKIKYANQNILVKTKDNNELRNSLTKHISLNIFSCYNLLSHPNFEFLCGLTCEKFDALFKIVEPYCEAIDYPSCQGTGVRKIDKATELLTVLVICRHSLPYQFMAHILKCSTSTVHRIFVG